MKKSVLAPIFLLWAASLACGLPARSASPLDKISTPTQALTTPTNTQTRTAEPSNTPAPVEKATTAPTTQPALEDTPTLPAPTVSPSPTQSSSIEDTFEQALKSWNKFLVVTTQATLLKSTVKVIDGQLVFGIIDKETYLYQFHKTPLPADVTVETIFTNQGVINNGVALVCRAAPDNSSWYEVRLSNQGSYKFFLYDRAKKAKTGSPYLELGSGAVNFNFLYPDRLNRIQFTCKGGKLSLDVNQGKKVFSIEDDTLTSGGMVGVGVFSYDEPAVTVAFDEFKAQAIP